MVSARDITIEVRLRSFGRAGVIDLADADNVQVIKRFNSVGAWKLTLPNDNRMTAYLKQPGAGILVYIGTVVFLSGPMLNWTKSETRDDPIGKTDFVGADDMIYLSMGLAYPVPGQALVTQQIYAYDKRTGAAETVMKDFVRYNIGPNAQAVRKQPIGNVMRMETDQARGPQVTYSARFDKLGMVLADIGAVANLGFDMRQTIGGVPPTMFVYAPQDRSAYIRMDIANDLIDSSASGISAPTTTRAIVAGQGQADLRKFLQVDDADSIAAEQMWGFRGETFIDQRNTNDDIELLQSGTDEIQTNGRTIVSLKVTATDNTTMVFGKDWFIGDTVAVVVDDDELKAKTTEAILVISEDDVRLGASIGDPIGYDWESVISGKISQHERRIAFLEKNQ